MYVPFDTGKPVSLSSEQIEDVAIERINKEFLELSGVNVAQFTREKAISDLKEFFEWFCPQIKDWDIDYDELDVAHEFQPMGKKSVPKNVAKISISHNADEIYAPNMFSVYFSYLADGRINSADAHLWVNGSAIHLKVRLKKGEYLITEIKTTYIRSDGQSVVFKDNSPSDNVASSQVLDEYWEKLTSLKSDHPERPEYTLPEDYVVPATTSTSSQPQAKSGEKEAPSIMGFVGTAIGLMAIVFGIFSCASCMG